MKKTFSLIFLLFLFLQGQDLAINCFINEIEIEKFKRELSLTQGEKISLRIKVNKKLLESLTVSLIILSNENEILKKKIKFSNNLTDFHTIVSLPLNMRKTRLIIIHNSNKKIMELKISPLDLSEKKIPIEDFNTWVINYSQKKNLSLIFRAFWNYYPKINASKNNFLLLSFFKELFMTHPFLLKWIKENLLSLKIKQQMQFIQLIRLLGPEFETYAYVAEHKGELPKNAFLPFPSTIKLLNYSRLVSPLQLDIYLGKFYATGSKKFLEKIFFTLGKIRVHKKRTQKEREFFKNYPKKILEEAHKKNKLVKNFLKNQLKFNKNLNSEQKFFLNSLFSQ